MKLLDELLQNLNDREELAYMLLRGLNDEYASVEESPITTIETSVPDGKLWIIKPKSPTSYPNQAYITLVEDKLNHSLMLCVRLNDGTSTTFNHTVTYFFDEEDDQFFNLFVLINKNCLLR